MAERPRASAAEHVVGWDIGGAHVKACLMRDGRVVDVVQWACPLWQGMAHLERALELARAHWPALASATHAVTMTGEMTDLFEHREDGVGRIAAVLGDVLVPAAPERLNFYGGDGFWCGAAAAGTHWHRIASANWLATASHAAERIAEGVLIDIGSTTTDLIAFRAGHVLGTSRSDRQRLATGELVYQGVVRTPLCALGPRIGWQGETLNVMNEWFATTADVYRLTGELDPAHDLQPSADNASKDLPQTRRRLARMVGLDARDATADDWLAFARAWRRRQVDELGGQLRRVIDRHGLSNAGTAVSAGCGDFLAADVVAAAGAALACRRYGSEVARTAAAAAAAPDAATDDSRADVARWAQVCAPSVAVAALFLPGAPLMWVVKLGGSLTTDPALPQWLDLLAQLGGGRVTIVCGGGRLADEVRRTQARWQFNDLAAHNMAVLAMAQTAYQFQAMNPALRLAARKADIASVLHRGRAAIWLPFELQRDAPDTRSNWGATSDTIALDLARELNAEQLVVVKSCEIDGSQSLAELGAAGILDKGFGARSKGAAFPIEIMEKSELGRMRLLLLGDSRHLSGTWAN